MPSGASLSSQAPFAQDAAWIACHSASVKGLDGAWPMAYQIELVDKQLQLRNSWANISLSQNGLIGASFAIVAGQV